MKKIILIALNILGLALALSEGSTYGLTNIIGITIFAGSGYLLGLFGSPYKHR